MQGTVFQQRTFEMWKQIWNVMLFARTEIRDASSQVSHLSSKQDAEIRVSEQCCCNDTLLRYKLEIWGAKYWSLKESAFSKPDPVPFWAHAFVKQFCYLLIHDFRITVARLRLVLYQFLQQGLQSLSCKDKAAKRHSVPFCLIHPVHPDAFLYTDYNKYWCNLMRGSKEIPQTPLD